MSDSSDLYIQSNFFINNFATLCGGAIYYDQQGM